MPIYERRCTECDVVSTHLSKVADRDLQKDCPNCGCLDTVPIMSATRTDFVFADTSPHKG